MTQAEVEAAIVDVQKFLEYLLPESVRDPRHRLKEHVKRVLLDPSAFDDTEHTQAAEFVDLLLQARRPRGRQAKRLRNYLLCRALHSVHRQFGIPIVRSVSIDAEIDACSIVSEACGRLDKRISEGNLAKIWSERAAVGF